MCAYLARQVKMFVNSLVTVINDVLNHFNIIIIILSNIAKNEVFSSKKESLKIQYWIWIPDMRPFILDRSSKAIQS